MMMILKKIFSLLLGVLFVFACNPKQQQGENEEEMTEETPTMEILVSPVYDSPEFPDAILEMNTPEELGVINENTVSFSYEVTNYDLMAQTSDAETKNCANSEKGQHIHLILNNQPYTAHYEPEFEREIEDGHYVALSFLSRSYHESLKHPEAYVIRQFTIGDAEGELVDLSGPNLFYSRPKGTYSGDDTKKLLLDFYLINCDLSKEGFKVRATINGNEFTLTEWVPYFVEGLPLGEVTVKLELLDENGSLVDSPFNSVERTVTLENQEPV